MTPPPPEDPPDDPLAAFWGRMAQPWAASLGVWQAWSDAWGAVLRERGAPAAEAGLRWLADPQAWLSGGWPPLGEAADLLDLPKLADLPSLDAAAVARSWAPAMELAQVGQEYARVALAVWAKAHGDFQEALAQRRRDGQLDSPGEVLDLWNGIVDATLMEFNRSQEYADLQRRFLRAATRQRLELRRLAEQAARLVDAPTRSELDEVHRRMHDLHREVHRLRGELRRARAPQQTPRRGRTKGKA